MLFNLFGKKEDGPESIFVDKTYVNTTAKINACIALAKEQPDAMFICWFADTAKTFRTVFLQNGLNELKILDAKELRLATLQNKVPVFTEHYPLHSKELAFAEQFHLQKITVYSAMDEALFKHFGSEKMIPLMKLLGMKEDEPIEHSSVTKYIKRGQEKIAAAVIAEQFAQSQEEWMAKNVKLISRNKIPGHLFLKTSAMSTLK
jgi:hypothetical protein